MFSRENFPEDFRSSIYLDPSNDMLLDLAACNEPEDAVLFQIFSLIKQKYSMQNRKISFLNYIILLKFETQSKCINKI